MIFDIKRKMLKELLKERDYLPITVGEDGMPVAKDRWVERRRELLHLLEKYSYGITPDIKSSVVGEVVFHDESNRSCAGKVIHEKINVICHTEYGDFSIPVELFIPKKVDKPPVFLHIAFRPVPDKYIPVEEITDGGYALAVMVYTDIVNDNHHGDFSDGLAALFGVNSPRRDDEWGKIGMWGFGASRVLDYLITRDDIDTKKVAVIGHSRLGKTALWCAAQDERFAAAISNNSGYGGAASSKHGAGERVDDFLRVGSWDWYCENFKRFSGELEDHKPYDQSFLLALVAPRILIVGSAEEDAPADPKSEFLTSLHASQAWELLGYDGLITPDRMPAPGDLLMDGNVCYHYRSHGHFLSREDWTAYMKILDKKFK